MRVKTFNVVSSVMKNKITRPLVDYYIKRTIRNKILKYDDPSFSEITKEYQALAFWTMYRSVMRNVDKNYLRSDVLARIIEVFLKNVVLSNASKEARSKFHAKYGQNPPTFFVLSPTQVCNLQCVGCYAASSAYTKTTLSWDLVNQVIQDAHDNLGMRFFVISGGEPLMYRDNGKTILDLFEKWNDAFFLMYTNGTLINEKIALRMAELGNVTPAISLEGGQKETDERRGDGVFAKILKARDNLIKAGVPFGFSITATSKNIHHLLSLEFYEKLYEEYGATYLWIFQYMPIGRHFTKDLMITPEQRIELFKIQEKLLREKGYFLADFWNSAPMSNGCISSGRPGGYFYIDWNGNIMPCVFVPYYLDNIKEIYGQGKKLEDALFSPLFVKGREWQQSYLGDRNNPGNMLRPCFYRDHYRTFHQIATSVQAKPENEEAAETIQSSNYYDFMTEFDDDLKNLADPIWEEMKKTVNERVKNITKQHA